MNTYIWSPGGHTQLPNYSILSYVVLHYNIFILLILYNILSDYKLFKYCYTLYLPTSIVVINFDY